MKKEIVKSIRKEYTAFSQGWIMGARASLTCLAQHFANCATWSEGSKNPSWTQIGHWRMASTVSHDGGGAAESVVVVEWRDSGVDCSNQWQAGANPVPPDCWEVENWTCTQSASLLTRERPRSPSTTQTPVVVGSYWPARPHLSLFSALSNEQRNQLIKIIHFKITI